MGEKSNLLNYGGGSEYDDIHGPFPIGVPNIVKARQNKLLWNQ